VWKWHSIYRWKVLNVGYNFASNLTSIAGLHKKLWASKVARVPILRISRLLREKWHYDVTPMAIHKEYYKGEGDVFPQVRVMVSIEFMYCHDSSMHQKCSNYALTNLLFDLCISIWIIYLLGICHNPHPRTPACIFYLWSVANKGTYFNSFFWCFHFETRIWIFQQIWGWVSMNMQLIHNCAFL
jgi:hypothetical protein